MCRMERSAAGIVASNSTQIAQPRAAGRQRQTGDERQQHEQQRQVGGIVEVRRKPLMDEAVHRRGAQSLKRVPVNSDAVRIQRQPAPGRGRRPSPVA